MIVQTVYILLETTSGQNFSKIELYLGENGPQPPPLPHPLPPQKAPFHGFWSSSIKKFKNF